MGWFNYYGLAIVVIILLPNILYAIKRKGDFSNAYQNKVVEVLEQVGRYCCIVSMIFNIPYTYFNFWFANALIVYLSVNGVLCVTYLICWITFWNKNGVLKALLLSVLPSLIFIFSGVMLVNIVLIVAAVIFAVNHILLSYKNATNINSVETIN